MTLLTNLTDNTTSAGVHAGQHNLANQAILDLQAGGPGGSGGKTPRIVIASADATPAQVAIADATCTGTGDQALINSAITEIAESGVAVRGAGGLVELVGENFGINGPILLKSNAWVGGQGAMQTMIAVASSWSPGTETGIFELATVNEEFCGVFRLGLTSIASSSGNITAFWIDNAGGTLQHSDAVHTFTDIYVNGIGLHGVHFGDGGPGANKVTNVRVFLAGGCGYYVNNVDNFFVNCEAGASGSHGFWVADANNMFLGCKGWFSGQKNLGTPHAGNGWYVTDSRNTLAGCQAQDNNGDGFNVDGDDNTLSGCTADSNGYSQGTPGSPDTGSGFYVTAGRINISGTAIDKDESGRGVFQQYGVHIVNPVSGEIRVTTNNNRLGSIGGLTSSPGLTLSVNDAGVTSGGGIAGQSFSTPSGLTVQSAPSAAPTSRYIGPSGESRYLDETTEPPIVASTLMTSGGAFYTLQGTPPWHAQQGLASGNATVANNIAPPGMRVPYSTTLRRVDVHATTAPTGASLTVQVVKNGTVVATTVVAAGSNSGRTSPVSIALATGDLLTFNITTIGSTVAGAGVGVALSSVTNRTYVSTIEHDTPSLYLPLAEASGATAADLSGNGYNGTYTGTVSYGVAGPLSDGTTAIGLDGSTAYVTVPNQVPLRLGAGPWSIEFWVNFLAAVPGGTFPDLIGMGGGGAINGGWLVFYDGSQISFKAPKADGTIYQDGTAQNLVGAWNCIALTYDGTNLSYYFNGVLQFADTVALHANADTTDPFRIGYINHYAAARFAHVGVYGSKCLTPVQMAAHYAARLITVPSYAF